MTAKRARIGHACLMKLADRHTGWIGETCHRQNGRRFIKRFEHRYNRRHGRRLCLEVE